MVAVVVEAEVDAGRDAAGQILQAFEQVGLRLDMRRLGDQALRLGDRVDQWLGIHRRPVSVHYWNMLVEFPT